MPRGARLGLTVLLAVSCFAATTYGQDGPPPAKVRLDDVRLETVERWREVTGELRAVRRSIVAAEEPGQIVEIPVEAGDRIRSGQVIARLDDALARLEVERATALMQTREAIVAERIATLEKSQRDLARIEDSFARAGAAQIEIDEARTNKANAEARLLQARADVAWAGADLRSAAKRFEDMTIEAPFDGVAVSRRTELGQWVREGDAVIELVALDALDAWLDVPEAFAARLFPKEGHSPEVVLRVPALRASGIDETIRATVSSVIPAADPLSRLFPVRVRLENKPVVGSADASNGGPLRPGMTVVGLIPTGETTQALTVHKDAILRNETGPFVYFDGGGVAAIAPVRIDFAVGQRVVVQSPALQPGMKVVIEGNERMFPGQPLLVIDAPPGGGAAAARP
ncbi:MAG: efflux RND transporter periplasmic adaptor subunit [Phycisphaeraceae bacterium]|nr:efflux RND transporter periplasmic adaptor subunit [Phycisphaeraceae bacterium]